MELQETTVRALRYLLKQDRAVSLRELARYLGVGRRAVGAVVEELDGAIRAAGGVLQRKRGQGVLVFLPVKQYDSVLCELRRRLTDASSRRRRLIEVFLSRGEKGLSVDEIASEVWVSKRTVDRDLGAVRSWFAERGAVLRRSERFHVLEGPETVLRKCFFDFITLQASEGSDKLRVALSLFPYATCMPSPALLRNLILDRAGRLPYAIADVSVDSIVLGLLIAIVRNQTGHPVEAVDESSAACSPEFEVAADIARSAGLLYGVRLPRSEVVLIAANILGSKKYPSLATGSVTVERSDARARAVAHEFIRAAGALLALPLDSDPELERSLVFHLEPALYRAEFGLEVENPLLSLIRGTYPLAFSVARRAMSEVETVLELPHFSDDEIGYLAAHLGAAIERMLACRDQRIRALVACPNGLGTSALLKASIARRVPEVEIVGVTSVMGLDRALQEAQCELVVSTVTIDRDLAVPVVTVEPCPTEEDLSRLRTTVIELVKAGCSAPARAFNTFSRVHEGGLLEALSRDAIELDYAASDWRDAVTRVGHLLERRGCVVPRYTRGMVELIERIGGYSVTAGGVALPHARPEDGVVRHGVALVRLKSPVAFPRKEGTPVDLIFGLAGRPSDAYFKMMEELTDILSDEASLEAIRKATCTGEVLRVVEMRRREAT